MAKKNQVFIDVVVDDKGTTKRVAVDAKKLGVELDKAGAATDKATRGTDKLGKSNKDLDRNMRGTAKMTSNSTKEFSKMQQGMGGLVGAYATLAAQVFAVSAAFQFLQVASDFRNLIAGQEALGATTGVAFKTITSSIIEATDAQIQYGEAARAAAIGTAAGLSPSQLTDLGTAAKNASFALGRDLTDSFNRLVRGVTKAEPELLDELGIILRLETATAKFGASIGKTKDELNAFERTQAVTNDVLEQAERKFGAIEALMDPNAAALNQFTKSFDDLIKGFQVGLIETLIPALNFLAKNTAALTAALALFALPILKAILPSMKKWKQSSMDAADEAKKLSKTYGEELDKQTAMLEDNLKRREAAAAKAADKAKSTALKRGTDVRTGSGMEFLTSKEKGNRGAAARILSAARKQMNEHGKITTGALKDYDEKQLRNMEKSYEKRVAVSATANNKIRTGFQTLMIQKKRLTLGFGAAWQVAMTKMAGAAAFAAGAINAAFAFAGIIGVVTLIISAGKAIKDFFFPLTEEIKAQTAQVESLTGKYRGLTEELERSAFARKTLLAGTEITSNQGQALQSIDVNKFIEDMQFLEKAEETGIEGTKDFRLSVEGVQDQLIKISPEFEKLIAEFKQGGEEGDNAAIKIRNLASTMIDLGQKVDNLPKLFTELDKSFAALSQSSVKLSPIQNYLKASKAVVTNLDMQLRVNKEVELQQQTALDAQRQRNKEQAEMDKNALKRVGAHLKKRFEQATFEEKIRMRRSIRGTQTLEDAVSDKELKSMEKAIEATQKQATELAAFKRIEDERQELIGPFEKDRIKRAEALGKLQDKVTKSMNLGLTVQGRIANLDIKRLANANKFEKAEQARAAAQLAFKTAAQDAKLTNEEALVSNVAKVKKQREELEVANKIFATAERQKVLDDIAVQMQERKLEFERDILATKLAQITAEEKVQRLQREQKLGEALGGPGFMSAADRRQSTIDLATAAVEAQRGAVKIAQETFESEFQNRLKALGDERGRALDPEGEAGLQLRAEMTRDDVGGVRQANQRLEDLNVEKTLAESTLDIQLQKLAVETETALFKLEGIALTEKEKFIQEQILIAKQEGRAEDEAGIEAIRAQSGALFELMEMEQRRQGIADKIRQGMEGAFTAMIDGSKSAKDAFKDMAKGILKHLASIIAEMMVAKILSASIFGGFFADGGISAAKGTITPKKQYAGGGYTSPMRDYSRGGIARGPQQGYNAVLHGNEAVVPLPDNRHIPVELSGGMGQQNIVTVNVTMGGQGTAQTSSQSNGPNAERMGTLIAKAVQEELQNQKRSGGILSPYGVA